MKPWRAQHRGRQQRQADIHHLGDAAEFLLGVFAGLDAGMVAGVVVADRDHGGHALDRIAFQHHRDVGCLGLAQQRHDALLVDRRDDQHVDALGDEVLGGGDLLGDVEIGVLHLELDAELGGAVLHALDDVLVPFVRGVVDDVADLLRHFLRQRRRGGHRHGSGGEKQFLGPVHAYLPMTVGFSSGRFVPPSRVVTISLTC